MEENDSGREPLKEKHTVHIGAIGHVGEDNEECVNNIIEYLKSKIEDEGRGRE